MEEKMVGEVVEEKDKNWAFDTGIDRDGETDTDIVRQRFR